MNTISEIKAESIRMTDLAKQEVTSSSEKNADEQSLLIQTKKTLYELRETMDPETYEKMLTSLTEMEKSAADNTENVSVCISVNGGHCLKISLFECCRRIKCIYYISRDSSGGEPCIFLRTSASAV